MIDPATAEAAAVLRWSTGAARERIDLAGTLLEDLPGVFEALDAWPDRCGEGPGDHGGHL